MRINVGCGRSPTPGWSNFDNSPSVRFSQLSPVLITLLAKFSILNQGQCDFITFCRSQNIVYADALSLPLPDHQVDVIYSSHMLEHLDQYAARCFLQEAKRLLKPGGIIRLVVPDLEAMVLNYMKHLDGNAFLEQTLLIRNDPRSLGNRLAFLITGDRGHKYLYDARSLCRLLAKESFVNPCALPPGETTIPHPGELNLREREAESIYVEALAP
ncbi:MAG: class I SAM-dependent methyltransferase [Magnetococcales bacterium]|nr:class I SAM-dependent methyltransferase [Magnetococcales bacterium]